MNKPKTRSTQMIHYPAGFEKFFREATDILLPYIERPHYSAYLQQPTRMERQIYGGLQNLMAQGGFSPVDRFIRSRYMERLGLPSTYASLINQTMDIFKPSETIKYYTEPSPIVTISPILQQLTEKVSSLERLLPTVSQLEQKLSPLLQFDIQPTGYGGLKFVGPSGSFTIGRSLPDYYYW